jgi:hypothetical protein
LTFVLGVEFPQVRLLGWESVTKNLLCEPQQNTSPSYLKWTFFSEFDERGNPPESQPAEDVGLAFRERSGIFDSIGVILFEREREK